MGSHAVGHGKVEASIRHLTSRCCTFRPYRPAPDSQSYALSAANLSVSHLEYMMRFILLSLFLLTIVGCASTGTKYHDAPQLDTKSATVYIYRPQKYLLGAYDARLAVDGASAAEISGGGYTYLYVSEGCHNIQLSWSYMANFGRTASTNFCPQAGESYYVQIEGFNVVSWRLSLVGRENALPDIGACEYQPPEATPI